MSTDNTWFLSTHIASSTSVAVPANCRRKLDLEDGVTALLSGKSALVVLPRAVHLTTKYQNYLASKLKPLGISAMTFART